MKRSTLFLGIMLAIAMLLVAGCSNDSTNNVVVTSKTQSGPIKLGVLAPLTGEAGSFGQNALAGVKLATAQINAQGGINGRQVELYIEDDTCSAKGVNAIQKLINVDNVDAIVGPVCSASAGPAMPIAQQNDVPTVMFAASAPTLTSIGDNIFRVYPSDAFQGRESAEFVFNSFGTKVAVIHVQNDWGEGIQQVFKEKFVKLGGEVVYESGVPQTQKDFRAEIAKVKNSGADALYVPLYPNNGIGLVKQIKEVGLDLPVIGGDAFSGDEFIKSGYADGTIFVVPKVQESESFKSQILKVPGYKDLETNFIAPLGYDAANVMFTAMKTAGTNPSELRKALHATSLVGKSAPKIEFDSRGDLKRAVYEWKIVRNDEALAYTG